MLSVDQYAEALVASLGVYGCELEKTRVAKLPFHSLLHKLSAASFAYMATPAAMSTNARLLDGEFEVPRDRWTRSRMGHGQVVHTELVNDHLDEAVADGQLFVVDSIDECSPLLLRLREALEYRLAARAWINLYLVAANRTNFGLHSDSHDTIIIQLLGRKAWHVDETPRGVPDGVTVEHLERYEMGVGDVLAMAGNTAHNVVGVGELSLHLTIGFDRGIGLSHRLKELDTLLGRETSDASSADRVYAMAMTPDRRTGSSLPFKATHHLEDCRYVRWATRLPPLLEFDGDDAVVISGGARYRFPSSCRATLEALARGEELPLDEVRDLSGFDEAELLAFLANGVQDGVLICRF